MHRTIRASWTGLFLIGCVLATADSAAAVDTPLIAGHLVLDGEATCDDIPVTLEWSENVPFRETRTDSMCKFTFNNVQKGSYFLHVAVPGFEQIREPVNISSNEDVRQMPIIPNRTADQRGRSDDLTLDVSEIMKRYPDEARDLYHEALDNHKKGELNEAVRNLEASLRLAPDFYQAHNQLGIVYKALGRLDESVSHLRRAHELNPREAAPLITLGGLLVERKEYKDAERALDVAIYLDPRSAAAFFNLGLARYYRKKMQLAEEAFHEALRLAPDLIEARLALATIYGELGQIDKALREIDRYLERAPKSDQRDEVENLRDRIQQSIGPPGSARP